MIHDSDIQMLLTMVQPESYTTASNYLYAMQLRVKAEVEKRVARMLRDRDRGTRSDLLRQNGGLQR